MRGRYWVSAKGKILSEGSVSAKGKILSEGSVSAKGKRGATSNWTLFFPAPVSRQQKVQTSCEGSTWSVRCNTTLILC